MAIMTWDIGKYANPVYWPSAVSAVSLVILTITGIILALWYEPSPERAYESITYIQDHVHLGQVVLALHHWATHLLLASVILHGLRIFFMGTYKGKLRSAWVVGSALMVLTVLFVFTGYLLRYDELGYWSIRVTASIVGYTPLIGNGLESFILGGVDITSRTLARFYLWHIGVLPLAVSGFLGYHYYLVRKRQVSWAEVGVGFMSTGFLILYSVLYPFLLTPQVGPELTTVLKPVWPFLWLYTIERSLPPSLNFLNIIILLLVAVLVTATPYLDNSPGVQDRKRTRWVIGIIVLALFIGLSVVGYLWGAPV